MNKVNYDAEMQKIIALNKERGVKPKLLLHACCAPCSTACLDKVMADFAVTVFFYNPNMDGKEEYDKRAKEEIRLCERFSIPVVVDNYEPNEFYSEIKGLENEKEGGKRCEKCFYLRLKKTAEYAKGKGFDYFTTTLTLSPLKDAELLNTLGQKIAEKTGVSFLPSDFKKRDGYKKSVEMSKELSLYRQNYCGCVFSKKAGTEE